jgi:signal transduction histidine kinase
MLRTAPLNCPAAESQLFSLVERIQILGMAFKHSQIEWGFIALLIALCAVLTALQYRWTGEVSRAETERIRDGLAGQAQAFGNAFDTALTESCDALLPGDGTLNDQTREAVHVRCFQKWKAAGPRPMFKRIAVAVPNGDGIRLFEQDQTTGKLMPTAWTAELADLREYLEDKWQGWPSFESGTGELFEYPIMDEPRYDNGPPDAGWPPFINHSFEGRGPFGPGGPRGRHRPGESEWVIFELDTNYLVNAWLPELMRTYINPAGQTFNDVVIRSVFQPGTVIYASSPGIKYLERPVTVRFNRQGRDPNAYRGLHSRFNWNLEVETHPGALEAVVSAARDRNLAVAIFLNGLLLGAGFALVHHARRSRQLAEAQLNFVANVSHELRTPLTVIRGAAHNLKRGVVQERSQIEQYAGLIIQHAEQLGEMVEQVLQLAGAKKNQSAALRQPVALAEVLNEAVAVTAHDREEARCEIHLELPPNLPVIAGDAAALRRVFQNLITNAAKHGGPGGWIGVTAVRIEEADEPAVEIQVADRGPGIPPDEQAEIFKPFFRGALAQTMQIRGSGLGLSLVREIVAAHGGTVSVESQKGQETTFTVRLPLPKK